MTPDCHQSSLENTKSTGKSYVDQNQLKAIALNSSNLFLQNVLKSHLKIGYLPAKYEFVRFVYWTP